MQIQTINKKHIKFDPQNPRSQLDTEDVALLQQSIELEGQQEPVHLELLGKDDYMVNEGNKRVAAILKSNKIMTVEAIVEQKLSPENRLIKQIIIDTHRKNWNLADRDKAWERLWKMGKYDVSSFSKKISVSSEVARRFIDRMNLGNDFVKKIENVSASNIDETRSINDVDTRKKVLVFADKKGLGRIDVRKLSRISDKLSKNVINEVINEKISIDDAENMVGLDEEKQVHALETTKALNKHKTTIKKMLNEGKIDNDIKPFVEDLSKKVYDFQMKFFKLSADLRAMSYGLEQLSQADSKKYMNTQMEDILRSCLNELESSINPAVTTIKKTLGELRK